MQEFYKFYYKRDEGHVKIELRQSYVIVELHINWSSVNIDRLKLTEQYAPKI